MIITEDIFILYGGAICLGTALAFILGFIIYCLRMAGE